MWVKGHSRQQGNGEADKKAKEVAWVEKKMLRPDIGIPAGIRQAYSIHFKSRQPENRAGRRRKGLCT